MYTAPIQIFGDESHFKGIVTYALLIIPRVHLDDVEEEIVYVKEKYDVACDSPVHCSELFNEEKKASSAFSHLTFDELANFLADLTVASYWAGARGWVGYWDTFGAPAKLEMQDWDEPRRLMSYDISSTKTRTIFTSQAAMAPVTHFIGHQNLQAWIDHEATMVSHFGQKEKRVDQLVRFFPVNHNDRLFVPTPVAKDKPVFLQVADVLAYAASHALVRGLYRKWPIFEQIVNGIRPGYSEVGFRPVEGSSLKAVQGVRPFDRDDRVKNYLLSFLTSA